MDPADEPSVQNVLATKKKKLKICAGKEDAIIHMPVSVWWNLILARHLSLVELIKMKRLCKVFSCYKPLNGKIMQEARTKYAGKFVWACTMHYGTATMKPTLAVYSSKALLFDAFIFEFEQMKLYMQGTIASQKFVDLGAGYASINYSRSRSIFTGIDEEVKAYVERDASGILRLI